MTLLSRLAAPGRHLAAELMFLALLAQLALCLYQWSCRAPARRRAADGAVCILLLTGCAEALRMLSVGVGERFPWLLLPPVCALVFLHAALGLRREHRASAQRLTPDSVKEALDNLNSGILFSDAGGRVVLVNYAMGELCTALNGSYPRLRSELTDALEALGPPEGSGDLFLLPDGRVWRIQTVSLDDPALEGFTQTTAQDVTEIYDATKRLAEENAALRSAIAHTSRMLDRVAERVREEETLAIKVQVHNDIGRSLIALSELLRRGAGDPEEQLRVLHRSVGLFAAGGSAVPGTFDAARREAEALGVVLETEGGIPADAGAEALIAAAARECVTNCVRHAGGSRVTVAVREAGGLYRISVTNDGSPPAGPITEGGGLGSLRRCVEDAGGSMRVRHAPRFVLELELKQKGGRAT